MGWSQLAKWLAATNAVPLLFVLFLVPRIAILFLPVDPTSDAQWYVSRAIELATGKGYQERGFATAFWPPGWPLALAAVFKAFGPSLVAAQIFNLVCSFASAWLTFDLGRRLFHSELAGRAALLLLAIYPNSIGYVPLMLTEVFYTTLLLAGCWLLIVPPSIAGIILGGAVFGLAVLVKAQTLLVVPLIVGIQIMRDWGRRSTMISHVVTGVCVSTVALLVVLPWSLRNHAVFGEWVVVSTNGGLTLLTGNNDSARGDYTPNDALVASIPRTVENQLEVDKEARRRAIDWIAHNPLRFVLLMPLKVFRLWAPDGEAEWAFQAGYGSYDEHFLWFRIVRFLNQLYYFCLLAGFATAALLIFVGRARPSRRRWDWWALPFAIVLYPTAIAMIFSGQSRFHYPIMPFIVMACGWLLVTRRGHGGTPSRRESVSANR